VFRNYQKTLMLLTRCLVLLL